MTTAPPRLFIFADAPPRTDTKLSTPLRPRCANTETNEGRPSGESETETNVSVHRSRAGYDADGTDGEVGCLQEGWPDAELWMVWNAHAQQLERIDEEDGDGAWPRSIKHEPQELVYTLDMAPAEDQHQFVSWAQVCIMTTRAQILMISICEQVCGRIDKSLRKGRAKAVRRTLRTSSYAKTLNICRPALKRRKVTLTSSIV